MWAALAAGAVAPTVVALLVPAVARAASTITIVNTDGAGQGFNDPTPVAPVGGNPGTTLGQQRLNVVRRAADLWQAVLDSAVEIRIDARFAALPCSANAGTLGSAGPTYAAQLTVSGLPPNVIYPAALADRLAGTDLSPSQADIQARFNGDIGVNPDCLTGLDWYYGYDGNVGASHIELLIVVLHELGHGLGFTSFANPSTGAFLAGQADIFSTRTLDVTSGLRWDQMNSSQRAASAVNVRQVAWIGAETTAAVPTFLAAGAPSLAFSPPVAGFSGHVGEANFGPAVGALFGQVVLADPAQACSPPGNVSGVVALVDRGSCTFHQKVLNAQAGGAIAVIVGDTDAGLPPASLQAVAGLAAPAIPALHLAKGDADLLKAALDAGAVTATFAADGDRRVGADPSGHALLYAANPVVTGSSLSHFEPLARPNLLMEPFHSNGLAAGEVDLTRAFMIDIGWRPFAATPDAGADAGSDLAPDVGPDLAPDATPPPPDAAPDAGADLAPDVAAAAPDVGPDLAPDATPPLDAGPDLAPDAAAPPDLPVIVLIDAAEPIDAGRDASLASDGAFDAALADASPDALSPAPAADAPGAADAGAPDGAAPPDGARADAGTGGAAADGPPAQSSGSSGCGCETVAGRSPPGLWAPALVGGALMLRRRRRRG